MQNRLLGLDALRGIAALLVVWHHALGYLSRGGSVTATAILEPFDYGKFGVALFFLISGYVIPASFNRGLTGFAIGRAARILPALWLSMFVHMIAIWYLFPPVVIAANMIMLAEPLGLPLVSLPYWTLQWELAFYILCAGLFVLGRLERPRTVFALALAAVAGSFWWPPLLYLAFMFAGSLVRLKQWRSVAVLAALAMVSTLLRSDTPQLLALWLAPPTFFLFLRWDTHNRAFIWLGTVSYSLYLFHPTVVHLLDKTGIGGAPYVALSLGASIAVAACVYRWVERPIMLIARRLTSVNVNLAAVQSVGRVRRDANRVNVAGAGAK